MNKETEKTIPSKTEALLNDLRIPLDPERIRFPENKTAAELMKWKHYAFYVLGEDRMKALRKRNLIVIPADLFWAMLEQYDPEAFTVLSGRSSRKGPGQSPDLDLEDHPT